MDAGFGNGGKLLVDLSGADEGTIMETLTDMALQSDGKIVATGDVCSAFGLVRYDDDGSLDTSFGVGGRVLSTIGRSATSRAIALQDDGKYVVAGSSWNGDLHVFTVARYLPSGALDPGFGIDGVAMAAAGARDSQAVDVVVQPDGKILAAGRAERADDYVDSFALVRWLADGSLDPSFGSNGVVTATPGNRDGVTRSVALQDDGSIIVGGGVETGSDQLTKMAVIRFFSDGGRDDFFGIGGEAVIGVAGSSLVEDLLIRPDDRIVVIGHTRRSGTMEMIVAELQWYGRLDGTFGSDGIARPPFGQTDAVAVAGALQSDGAIVIGGWVESGGFIDTVGVRLREGGQMDWTFGTGGVVIENLGAQFDGTNAVVIRPGGEVVLGGFGTPGEGRDDFTLMQLGSDGGMDPDFGNAGVVFTSFGGSDEQPSAVTAGASGELYIVGGANRAETRNDFAALRLQADGRVDDRFGNGGNVITDVGNLQDWAKAAAVQDDGKLVVAGYSHSGATGFDFAVARYNDDGSLDEQFGENGVVTTALQAGPSRKTDRAEAVLIQDDGKLVVGGRSAEDFVLVRYLPDGRLDPSFSGDGKRVFTEFGYSARALAIQPDGMILLGGYERDRSVNVSTFALVRVKPDGSVDPDFGEWGYLKTSFGSGNDRAYAVAVQRDGKILLGGSQLSGLGSDFALVRYLPDGSLDPSFGDQGRVVTPFGDGSVARINDLHVQGNGRILAIGESQSDGILSAVIVRHLPDGGLDPDYGDAGLAVLDLGLEVDLGEGVSGYVQQDGKTVIVAPGRGACDIDFLVARFDGDPLSADLSVEHPAGTPLSGDGLEIDFGGVLAGTVEMRNVTLFNAGNADLLIEDVALEGAPSSGFELNPGGWPEVLAPGEEGEVALTFAPLQGGAFSAMLTIRSSDEDEATVAIDLRGFANSRPLLSDYIFQTAVDTPAIVPFQELLAAASDPDGDAVNVIATGPSENGGLGYLRLDSLVYLPPPGFSGIDRVPITVADVWGAAVTIRASVRVGRVGEGRDDERSIPSFQWRPDGTMIVEWHGAPDTLYHLERSIDLKNWEIISTGAADPEGGIFQIDHHPAAGRAFYRLSEATLPAPPNAP